MGIFNIQFFKRKDENHPPNTLQKDEWIEEAMPLFPPASISERIQTYQLGFDALTCSEINRTHDISRMFPDVVHVIEHRYVLDTNAIADSSYIDIAKKAYAMTSGSLRFLTAAQLNSDRWDTGNIVGQIPDSEIGALQLILPGSFKEYWNYFYPQLSRYELDNVYYFNINLDTLDERIKPLIQKHVSEKLALETLSESSIVQSGDWVDDYFQLFLTGTALFSVSGGDIIADIADNDRLNPDGQHYRLSVFYLQGGLEHIIYDNTPRIDDLFTFRQRLPTVNSLATALEEGESLAGHPLITNRTEVPIAAARVDLVDQGIYGHKNQENLELDPDSDPPVLRLQKPPTSNQIMTAQYHGVDLTGHGTAYFTLYNPDGQNLTINGSSGALTFSQTQVGANDWQPLISVSSASPIPDPTYIDIYSDSDMLKRLQVKPFDFKLLPVSFWYLDPLGPNDFDFDVMYTELNRILGRQANVFVYPESSTVQGPQDQTVQIPSLNNPNDSIEVTVDFKNQARQYVENAESSEHDINVIFTWKLRQDQNGLIEEKKLSGLTSRTSDIDPRPIIFVDVTTHSPTRIGGTVAHEIGHFFGQQIRREAATTGADLAVHLEEFYHGIRGNLDTGSSSFIYNLMYIGRPAVNKSLTTRQTELINAGASNII